MKTSRQALARIVWRVSNDPRNTTRGEGVGG